MEIDYSQFIQQFFPDVPSEGFYRKGRFPATILGKVLLAYPQIQSPAEVLAFYYRRHFFSSTHLVLTAKMVYGKGMAIPFSEIKEAVSQGKKVLLYVNRGGSEVQVAFETSNEKDAKALARFFEAIAQIPKTQPLLQQVEAMEKELNRDEIRWIQLKDHILQTIEVLHTLYQTGRISLIEYEETRQRLLERL